jgi:hypothetical protein
LLVDTPDNDQQSLHHARAVTRVYEHAAFMDALVQDGFAVLGGPLGDEVRGTLADDPWSGSHLVVDSVEPWTIRLDGRRA